MPTTDPRIDQHIANAGEFARPILERFRALVHREVPDCVEAIKWGMPHFTLGGKNLAGMAAFKAHVSIFFHNDEQSGGTGPFRKIASPDDFPEETVVVERLTSAVARLAAPKPKVPRAAIKPVPELPEAFSVALTGAGHAERFAAMPPGQRREYIEWIVEAKTDPTRDKRIAQAVEWIGEGKSRNWKYQNC
ncbi:YdeI/OmpD-associated family protein [Novosphingobium jiangmenense]|uniref:YdeI/OmpD-associated family protein n=1 Tax=Novosphingobium jiangmenense TaxID=2791981 RepID=A0ABS0HCN6_9SPHN|nr:YdeI/OmpD-associated family protein [Novosphingobium jiangmenense]MBF9150016.1 YdeI/OmpD-associated family protein [Novosphingobium jiangmenense]